MFATFEVTDDILGGVKMAFGSAMAVLGEEIGDGGDVGTSGGGEPLKRAAENLEFAVISLLCGGVEVGGWGNFVDRETGAIGRGDGGDFRAGKAGAFNEGVCKGFLAEMEGDVAVVVARVLKVDTEEMSNVAFEGGGNLRAEGFLKFLFDEVGLTKINKVVDVKADVERRMTFYNSAVEHA